MAVSVMQRSMTVSSTDFRRESKKKERQSNKMAAQQQPPFNVSPRESKLSSPEMPLEGGTLYVFNICMTLCNFHSVKFGF
jgi:hypothetical protein